MTQPIPPATREKLIRCWREGRTWDFAAKAAAVSLATVQRMFFEFRGANVPRGDLAAKNVEDDEDVPLDVLADREHRLGLMPRSIVAALAGDPLPGYSAWDRRRAAHTRG